MSVVIETTLGDITVDLYLDQRPVTCLNFLKLCKMKYYNFNLFHSIRSGFIAQTGDPTADGYGGESIFGLVEGPEKRFFSGEKLPKIRHTNTGTLSMVCSGDMLVGSQFFFTLAPDLDSLDDVHCVIGEVTEGHEVLRMLNDVICDESHRPYRDVRITHTVILEDPFNDPPGMRAPSRSPSPSAERLKGGRIAPDEDIDEGQGKSAQEIQEMIEEKEAKARATILEIVGDLPDADIAPPENVLFVCKLNPVTTDEDLEIIFSRFGKIVGCEVIRDRKSGDSLQYAFIEFGDKKSCEDAYFKMDNVLIDDRRIHVDFSQSVSRMRWMGKGKGIKYFSNSGPKDEFGQDKLSKKPNYKDKEKGDDNGQINDDRKQRHGSRDRDHHSDRKNRGSRDRDHHSDRKDRGSRDRDHHSDRKDRGSRDRDHHSDRKDRGSRYEKSEKHDRHARIDRDRSRRDRSRSRTDTDRHRSKRGRSRSVEKSERDKIKRSEKTERDRSRKDRSRSRDKRRQRDDKSNKSSRNERHRDKESSRSKKGRSLSRDRSRSHSRERSRRYDDSKKKSRKDRSQSRESRPKEKPAKLSDKDQDRKDHKDSRTHRRTDDRSRSRDRLTDNKESSTATDRLRRDSKNSLNESIGEDYKSDNVLTKNEARIDRSRSKEKTNHHENNAEEKSYTKDITDEPTNQSEKCVLDEKSKIQQESDSASYGDGKEEQSREVSSEEYKSSNTVADSYWSQIPTEPMKKSEPTTKHKSISPNRNERSKSHEINHEAPVENHKNSTEDNTFEKQNKKQTCENSGILSDKKDETTQIIMHKQSEKNISDTKNHQHPKEEEINSNDRGNNEKIAVDSEDQKKNEHSRISVASKRAKHSVKDKSKKSDKGKDPHSPTPVLDKKERNKKVDNKKKKIKVLKKKRKQSSSSSSSSSDTSTTSDSSSSEDERKKKSVKRRRRKVSSSTSSSSSSVTSSSSSSESSSSSSSDSEPRKKKRKKVVHTKVIKSKKTKKKL